MNRIHVLLLFGGMSAEHEVSVASAHNIFAALDDEKYEVSLGYIDKKGKWWLVEALDSPIVTHGRPQLVPVFGTGQFATIPATSFSKPDVILPVLHGPNGEDGTVQSVARMLPVPIIGCDVTSAALCMDKVLAKVILQAAGLPIVPYAAHVQDQPAPDFAKLSAELGTPLFVKPANMGSSVGVSKVHNQDELAQALEVAHAYDRKVLIEMNMNARELEVAIFTEHSVPQVSGVGEIDPNAEFYTYQAKYDTASEAELIIPANLTDDMARTVQNYAEQAFKALDCRGLSRVDLFLTDDEKIYVNEINTFPGFTNSSMFPKLWRQEGVHYPQLLERLINDALHYR